MSRPGLAPRLGLAYRYDKYDDFGKTTNPKIGLNWTPVNWNKGEDVVISGSVNNDQAKEMFGSWKEPKPYIRIVPDPS